MGDALAQLLTPFKGAAHWSLPSTTTSTAEGAEAMDVGPAELGNGSLLGARSGSAHSLGDSTSRSTSSSTVAAHQHHRSNSMCSNNENACPDAPGQGQAPVPVSKEGGPPVLARISARSKLPGAPTRLPPAEGLLDRTNY